ncbi:MAG: ATP-binding cassette domain-containing protein, partial [Hyphomicrobiales bacterium]|nr:ATP-binding cassette domain-containing protein [Hyphomicrobiales bacterium]
MAELLRAESLSAGYGEARVIQNLSFALEDGRSLALLGRNGVGKTTLIDTLIGVTTRFSGRIVFKGEDIAALKPHARARRGLGWTPQERNIFRSLTVEENLTAVALP